MFGERGHGGRNTHTLERRRNERIALDCRAFQVGCDPKCEVFFDPQHDPAAKGRSAKFCLQEGGWYVRCSGGDMWIGTQRIAGATHVRSGDVIRMLNIGPGVFLFYFFYRRRGKRITGQSTRQRSRPLSHFARRDRDGALTGGARCKRVEYRRSCPHAMSDGGRGNARGEKKRPAMAPLGRGRSSGWHPSLGCHSGSILSVAAPHHYRQYGDWADVADTFCFGFKFCSGRRFWPHESTSGSEGDGQSFGQ